MRAEQRLDEHLDLLRREESQDSRALAQRVARRARWQRLVRVPLRAAASLLGATVHGLAALSGVKDRRR